MTDASAPADLITTDFPRFGPLSYREDELIVFPWGLPGFDHLKAFIALSLPNQDHLVWLQSVEDLAVALPAADPWVFFPEYDPRLPAFAKFSLDLDAPEDFTLLAICAIPEAGPMYMNLMAPIVVNLKSRVARQIALEAGGYSVATPVPDVIERPMREEASSV
jgi:flagellar assembly factor FliW